MNKNVVGASSTDPSGAKNKQAERSAQSDKKMFEAAIELINERGTAKTTLKDIGEHAGYSRGLASYRFGSKDGLWMELFDKFDDIWKQHIAEYIKDKSGLDALRCAIHAQRDIFRAESGYLRAMYILWYESLGEASDIRASLAHHHKIYRRDVANWLEQGVEAGDFSAVSWDLLLDDVWCYLSMGSSGGCSGS
jgi:AcrR family transcriptional regulator